MAAHDTIDTDRAFEIKTRDRVYVFIAPNTETMNDWIRAIAETAFTQPADQEPTVHIHSHIMPSR